MQDAGTTIEDLGSFKIAVASDDQDISRQVRENRWYSDEEFETTVFAEHLRPGMSILDVGGNIGFYTLLARSIAGPQGRVVVFEPYPRSAALIRASVAANAYDNVQLVQAAVSDAPGTARLYLHPDYWTEHSLLDLAHERPDDEGQWTLEVSLMTIDAALESIGHDFRVDFIKMDIEGGESRAVRGMRRVLDANPRLTLMTEFWPNGFLRGNTSPADFLRFLGDEGFSLQNIDGKSRQLVAFTVDELLELVERNAHRNFDNPVMKTWGWYTNLLCTRG